MAKANRTGRSNSDGKHVRLYEWLLKSPAYRALSCRARCLLLELHRLYNGDNNGSLFLSVRDAAPLLDLNKDTACKAFEELGAFGFITPATKSGFAWKLGMATTWVLTNQDRGRQPATKEFARVTPEQAAEIKRQLSDRWREARKARAKKKRGPAASDRLSDRIGQCPTASDTSNADCPTASDTFAPEGRKSVRRRRTQLVNQVGEDSPGLRKRHSRSHQNALREAQIEGARRIVERVRASRVEP